METRSRKTLLGERLMKKLFTAQEVTKLLAKETERIESLEGKYNVSLDIRDPFDEENTVFVLNYEKMND